MTTTMMMMTMYMVTTMTYRALAMHQAVASAMGTIHPFYR